MTPDHGQRHEVGSHDTTRELTILNAISEALNCGQAVGCAALPGSTAVR